MRRPHQRKKELAAGIAGIVVVLLLGLGLNLASQRSGQAQEPQALLPTLPTTPTPTIAPSPTPAPAVASTILTEDRFTSAETLADWEFFDVGVLLEADRSVWVVEDGSLVQNRTAAAGNPNTYPTMAFKGDTAWSDYTVSARFYDQGNGIAGLVARREGESFYRLRVLGDFYETTPKFVLEKVVDGEATTLASKDGPGFASRTWHTLSLSVVGTQIEARMDDQLLLEAQDSTLVNGQPGLFTLPLGNIRFGDFVVTAP
jgi:hypothetical protein